MKIGLAIETTFDSDAGVQQYFKGLGRYLLSQGHDVKFLATFATDQGEFKGRIYSTGIVFNPFLNTTSIPIGLYSYTDRLKKILQEEKFDVIHVGIPVSPISLAKLVKYATCPVVGTYMIHSQSGSQRFFNKLVSTFPINVSKHIDYFIAPNEKTRTDALTAISGDYHIIPHATDSAQGKSAAKPLNKFKDGRKNILYLGRLEDRKGVHLLLNAVALVVKDVPSIRLIVAGDGPDREKLEDLTKELKLTDHVVFEGYIDEDKKSNYFASAEFCVFPATYGECFGIVLIECLAAGKIPLAFANEGYGSVLENIPEVLVKNGDVEELAEKILHLLTDKKDKKVIEKKCQKEAFNFSWDSVGPQIEDIYKSLVT